MKIILLVILQLLSSSLHAYEWEGSWSGYGTVKLQKGIFKKVIKCSASNILIENLTDKITVSGRIDCEGNRFYYLSYQDRKSEYFKVGEEGKLENAGAYDDLGFNENKVICNELNLTSCRKQNEISITNVSPGTITFKYRFAIGSEKGDVFKLYLKK